MRGLPVMIGQTLGRYRVLAKIGAGGMGEVYRARDEQLERDVAVKVLPASGFSDPEARRRLLREARAAAALNHPHVCTIHEVGEADGQVFIAMELIEGQRLDRLIPPGGLPVEEVLRHGLQITDAVAHAHERGIVHRDLKTSNTLVTLEGRAKVLDFGLAKRVVGEALTGAVTESSPLTDTGAVVGTVPYMSPELLSGQPADTRSDVWALGVVLFEMAAGRRPFQGRTGFELSSAILNQPPAALPGKVPFELRLAIERCLEKTPERRYQRAGEVHAALETIHTGAAPLRTGVHHRLDRRGWLALAAVTAAAALGTGWWVLRKLPALGSRTESLVVLPLRNLSGDPEQEYFSDGMTDALIGTLSKISALRVISRTSAMRYKGTSKSLGEIARELKVDAIVEGSVLRAGDRVRISAQLVHAGQDRSLWSQSYERDLRDVLAVQRELAQAMTREIRVTLTPGETARLARAPSVDPEAYQLSLKGLSSAAGRTEAGLRKALEYYQQALERDPQHAPAHAGLAFCYTGLGSVGIGRPPREMRPLAIAAARQAIALDGSLGEAHAMLANALVYEWQWSEAERAALRALELNPGDPAAHIAYSNYLHTQGRMTQALEETRRAEDLDPLSPLPGQQVGYILYNMRRYDDAIRQLLAFLEQYPDNVFARWFLGGAYVETSRFDEAIATLETAVRHSGRAPAIVASLATAFAGSGHRDRALELRREIHERSQRGYVTPQAFVLIEAALGNRDEAFQWLEKALHERSNAMVFLLTAPWADPLRPDPRFRAMVAKVGLPLPARP